MSTELTREEVDGMAGMVLLEFGATWCHHCQAIQPELERLLGQFPQIHHIKVEDGRGKPLGRSFRVKLWPTLVLMRDGQVIRALVRAGDAVIREALEEFAGQQ